MLDYRNSFLDVEARKPEIAIFSIGAIEQHTAVLPLGTDTMIISEIAARVGRKLDAYVIPTVPFGTSYEHRGFPGTVFIRPDTLYHMIKEMISSCYEAGIMKVALLLGHGGLWTVKPAIRDLNYERPDGTAIWLCPFDKAAALLCGVIDTIDKEIHAGEFETSCIMALHPQTVKMEYAGDFEPDAGREYLDYVPMKMISPKGTWGCQTSASPEKGEAALTILTDATVDYISSTFAKLDAIKKGR
jgi:creatinine amidohydrolase